jgi:hypothetical protein
MLRVAGWSVAGVLAVATATGIGMAFAGPSGTVQTAGEGAFAQATPTPPAAEPDRPDRRGKPGWFPRGFPHGRFDGPLGRGMLHGEFVVKDRDGKITKMVTQHGKVTAVSANSVSLRSDDGFTGTYAVGSDTRVRIGGGPAAISGVKTGNEAWVVATKSGGTSTATVLVVHG